VRVALALLLLLLSSAAAHAREVLRDQNGGVLEASGFYKNFLSGLLLQPGTVEASRARGTPVPEAGAIDAHLARLAARFHFEDKFEFEVAYQLTFLVASAPAFATGTSLSGTVGGTGAGPLRRLVPLGGTLVQSDTVRLEQDLDRLAVKLALPFGDLTLGRQVLSWGTGRVWNPTDVLSPFPPTAIDREVRRGFDAVRLAVALGEVTQLDLLYLPQPVLGDQGAVARLQTNLLGWDGSVSLGKYVRDFVVGADLVGDIGPLAVHAEGAYTFEWLEGGALGEHFFRGVAGLDFKPYETVVVTAEYSFNGYGSTDPSRYAAILSSARALRGEVFGAGKHNAALAGSWRVNDLLSTQLSLLCNLTDPSALVLASLEYSFAQSVLVRVGAYVPLGRAPDAWGLHSEYGSGAYGAFVQVGLYVP
jgi:hypothetical protein